MSLDKRKQGIVYLVGATFCLALMSALVRLAGPLPVMQKLFVRSAVMALGSFLALRRSGEGLRLSRKALPPVLLRGLLGTVSVICNFYAIDRMLLADANMLNKISPFFTVLFSYLALKERFRARDLLTLVLAFCGTLLIIKPGGAMDSLPAAVAALGGVTAGMAFTALRASNKAGAPKPLIVFSFAFCSCLVSLPATALRFAPMSGGQWLCLLGCGLCGVAGHFLNTRAYACAPASEISVFDYSQVLFSAIFGFLLFHQLPDLWSLLGYALIIGTGAAVFLQERRATG